MSEEEVIDLYAMKVTELKAELKSRSLPVSGPKAELIERLEKYMQEHEGVTVVDEADLKDKKAPSDDKDDSKTAETGNQNSIEIEESEILNAPTSNDVKPNVTGQEISSMTEKDRIAARADRFKNETPGDSLKKKSRAERFGIPVKEGNVSKEDSDNALKRRAERFGTVSAKISKTEVDEKIKARAERFGTTTSASSAIASNDKIAARKARFGVV